MAIKEVPRSFEYVCDVCGVVHVQENAGGHYSNSRPPHWATLTFACSAEDFQGAAVADGTTTHLLCPKCRGPIREAINSAADLLRTSPPTTSEGA